ncbi:MAG: aldehyde dehydrogenase family protein [Planctomycetes bacterium]|nr:aldehyde dehydrogenase family protein [Planctomycetota bacterium]
MTPARWQFGTFGIEAENLGGFCGERLGGGEAIESVSPIDGRPIARVRQVTSAEFAQIAQRAAEAFDAWQDVPAPRRGQLVRDLGAAFRAAKEDLGRLITLEMGKILAEGRGEVQEAVDICDFAVGLSRQLYGLTTVSERPGPRMYEQWHPWGVVGIITAFNFPVAVWSWNAMIAAVCGDAMVWKPSSKTPLTAIACTNIAAEVCRRHGVDPALFSLAIGPGSDVGEAMLADPLIRLVSATGSCRLGRRVAEVVGKRLGRTLLELGGNNAIIVTPEADPGMAVRAILFGAVGTAGQRCTTTRRIIVHQSVRETLANLLVDAYRQVRIGDPLAEGTLMGPLVDQAAVDDMMAALKRVDSEGGRVLVGGERRGGEQYPGGCYVTPCIVAIGSDAAVVREETFAPILYVIEYTEFEEALRIHNDVPQGLSSAVFTRDLVEAETFLSARGSDCGIANVNIGTSGAEIGGAFGGEKDTGGGRESGSDAWKNYMRRQTVTINYSTDLPLAQGIEFGGGT